MIMYLTKIHRKWEINVHCFEISDAHKKYPFGGTPDIGCSDGLFTINNFMNMQKNNNLPTFVAFINLFKNFRTAGNKLLIKVLEMYVAAQRVFSDIHRMYQDLIVVLKVGNSVE